MNILSLSGGKDSTAMLLLAIEQGQDFRAVFADTGNEHQITYDYVNYLSEKLGISIQWVKADFTDRVNKEREYIEKYWYDWFVNGQKGYWDYDGDDDDDSDAVEPPVPVNIYQPYKVKGNNGTSWTWIPERRPVHPEEARRIVLKASSLMRPTGNPFLDLCLWKNRFPSTKARFCSEELKKNPILDQVIYPAIEVDDVDSWQGVRADESESRSKLETYEFVMLSKNGYELNNYRPILNWTAQDCFDMHKRHGIDPNPLYKQGMGRVGCMPCIHARKAELAAIAHRFPSEIERIAQWEELVACVSKHQSATFFTSDERGHGIRELVEWSKTTRGGKHYDIFAESQEPSSCSSIYGLCE